MDVIEIEDLTRDYGQEKGIFHLSLTVRQGEAFGFLGPNGAGKTTAIRHLMGFIRPLAGRCRINGLDCMAQAAAIQQSVGYIPGEIAFPEDMTGIGFVRFLAAYRSLPDMSRAQDLMARFELDPSGRLKKMSKGMKQKIAIVCAFMHDPQVLILDEPTSGLDPLMQNRFIELILEEKARGKTILLSSHMFEEVERTCDRVGILRRGRLAAVEETAMLRGARRRRFTVTFADPAAAAAFAREPLAVQAAEGERVTVAVQGSLQALIAALSRYPVTDIVQADQSLEELFLQLYGGEPA